MGSSIRITDDTLELSAGWTRVTARHSVEEVKNLGYGATYTIGSTTCIIGSDVAVSYTYSEVHTISPRAAAADVVFILSDDSTKMAITSNISTDCIYAFSWNEVGIIDRSVIDPDNSINGVDDRIQVGISASPALVNVIYVEQRHVYKWEGLFKKTDIGYVILCHSKR